MPGWTQFVGLIESSISFLHTALGSWGLAIILFTVAVKVITWPLTSKQLKSSKAMQELQPKIKALQEKYKNDKEKQTQEMMKLYQEMGVNPLMGCFPMLLQFPIWIGLYSAILALANKGRLGEGFFFIPSLACPSSDAAVCEVAHGMSWVLDFSTLPQTWPYLILPVLTIVTQIGVSKLMSPTPTASGDGKSDDPTQAMMKQMTTVMPLMFGFFALQFPAGLALYWVTNNVLTYIQYWVLNRSGSGTLLSLSPVAAAEGGALVEVDATPKRVEYAEDSKDGKARRKRKKR